MGSSIDYATVQRRLSLHIRPGSSANFLVTGIPLLGRPGNPRPPKTNRPARLPRSHQPFSPTPDARRPPPARRVLLGRNAVEDPSLSPLRLTRQQNHRSRRRADTRPSPRSWILSVSDSSPLGALGCATARSDQSSPGTPPGTSQ